MSGKKKPAGDYEVGYCRPPEHTRFRKGQSGNSKGRPKARRGPLDNVAEILNAPVNVKRGKRSVKMGGFEASVRTQVKRGLVEGNTTALIDALKVFEEYGAITTPAVEEIYRGVIKIPHKWDIDEWIAMYIRNGPPPWPGEHDGMIEQRMLDALARAGFGCEKDAYDD